MFCVRLGLRSNVFLVLLLFLSCVLLRMLLACLIGLLLLYPLIVRTLLLSADVQICSSRCFFLQIFLFVVLLHLLTAYFLVRECCLLFGLLVSFFS